ncbi:DUF2188 domain-containing protein [Mycobacteroides abscessus]|uniref:DUF2188 domain-containing protein n=1 Tax=Mycobacteroides abscessus TaxID=36809 RepID=UPI000D3E3FAD|nr:DUF2188 domain-containing protein [Mycobacteroides abscessus]PVB26549.1 hypothetical protein DDJ45_11360 [Mycobacteroides abscessus]
MSNSNDRYVVPNADGKSWDIKKGDAQRSSGNFERQSDAIKRAGEIVGNLGGGEVVIQNKGGKIREKNTIKPGNDPYPPKG